MSPVYLCGKLGLRPAIMMECRSDLAGLRAGTWLLEAPASNERFPGAKATHHVVSPIKPRPTSRLLW